MWSNNGKRTMTLPTLIVRLRLFYGSYAPLFVILAFRFEPLRLRIGALVIGALGFASLARLVQRTSRRVGPSPFTITEIGDHGAQVAGYLATYLLPFLVIERPSLGDLAAYASFIGLTGLIYIRSAMTEINPTLYLLRRSIARINTAEGFSGYAILRTTVDVDDTFRAVHLDDRLLLQVG